MGSWDGADCPSKSLGASAYALAKLVEFRSTAASNCLVCPRQVRTSQQEEAGPEGVIVALMGHVSRAMAERYSHVRMDAMRQAVESLSLTKTTPPIPVVLAKDSAKVIGSAAIQ